MAKKVVQSDGKGKNGKPVKKKRHGCRNCLITLLVFIVVLCAGGYFAGNFFSKKYLDMSLWSCFGVLHDLRTAKGKKIVTNKYTDADYTAFNDGLKDTLFLNDNADFGIDKLLTLFLDGESNSDENTQVNAVGYLTAAARQLGASVSADGVIDELSSLYVRENLNLERLDSYDESKHDTDYVLKITDKMLAAAINKSLGSLGSITDSLNDKLKDFGINDINEVAKVEQIIFDKQAGMLNGESTTVKTIKVTVSLDARKVAKTFLKERTGQNLGFLTKMFLPKRFYVTVIVPVESGATIDNNLYINNMSDGKMNRAYKLIGSITSLTGDGMDAKEMINEKLGGTVGNVMEKVNDVFPIAEAENHEVKFDVFDTLIELTGINKEGDELKPESKRLSAGDLINTLAGLVVSDADDAIDENCDYNYKNQYFDKQTDKVVYLKTNPGEGYEWIDYKQLFMDEIAAKYMLNLDMGTPDDTSDDVKFEDLMKLFGLGGENPEGKDLELLDLFDASRLNHVIDLPESERTVKVDSRMLGAILQVQIDSLIAGDGSLGNYNPEIEFVYTYKTQGHNMMTVGILIDASKLLEGSDSVASIVTGLVGDKAVIIFDIDITPTSDEEYERLPSSVYYNGINGERTAVILKTVSSFVESFDVNSLLAQIEKPMRDAIVRMNEVIKIDLCSSKIDSQATAENLPSAIELTDVFGAVKDMLFKDDENITKQGIESVLEGINDANKDGFEQKMVKDGAMSVGADDKPTYKTSLDNIMEAYYVKEEVRATVSKFDDVFGDDGLLNNVNYNDFDIAALKNASESDLGPLFADNDLAALIHEKIEEDIAKYSGSGENQSLYANLADVRAVNIYANGTIELVIRIAKSALITDQKQSKLIPADYLYLTAAIDTTEVLYYMKNGDGHLFNYDGSYDPDLKPGAAPEGYNPDDYADNPDSDPLKDYTAFYATKLTINEMTDSTYGTMHAMIESLNGGNSGALDLQAKASDLGAIVKEQLDVIEKAMGGKLKYEDGGMRLLSAYEFAQKAMASFPHANGNQRDADYYIEERSNIKAAA